MTLGSRFVAYLLLPAALFGVFILLVNSVGGRMAEEPTLYRWAVAISIIAAAFPSLVFWVFARSKLGPGFALLKSGKCLLPHELTIGSLIDKSAIVRWIPFYQPLKTTLCIEENGQRLFLKVSLDRFLSKDDYGRRIAANLESILPKLEQAAQRAFFEESKYDGRILENLDLEGGLLTEPQLDLLKSKVLSALEGAPYPGIDYTHTMNGIAISPKVKLVQIRPREPETAEVKLELDDTLLKVLG